MPREERVTRVIDGDTFDTASGTRVRLANVDAPELGAPGGEAAKRALERLIGDKICVIHTVNGSYGRRVAEVTVGRRSVNKAMRDFLGK